MNRRHRIASAIVAGMLATVPFPATAHHSMSEFDRRVVTEVEGVVSRISWKNPHIMLEVTGTDQSGVKAVWTLEGGAVSAQRRRGLTGDRIAVGDVVRVAGFPSTRRDRYLQVNHVLLPDGVELLVGGAREPRWSGRSAGSAVVVDTKKAAAVLGDSLFRVWSQGTGAWFFAGRSNYQLTPSAAAAVAKWDDIADNPLIKCVAPGMPGLMGNPYPMAFVQVGRDIELRFEEFDARRRIHMDGNVARPADVARSPLGYSVGHWEDKTLVVDTSRINWPYFDRAGAPQTQNVAINERFTVVQDGNRLDYVMTVNEPASLVKPFVWNAYFVWKPGEAINPYECTLEEWASIKNTLRK
ncbi:MAG: hypothetical protein EXQ53_11845 [Acidobacteria bacterium]|nr:hypothetical protein [Acidobacteriota bacterium]